MLLTDFANRRHAADQLGVPPDALPADARAAFLRKLPAAGFLPVPPLCAAAALLIDRPVIGAAGAEYEAETGGSLRAEVATFARSFWSIAPVDRRRSWQELLSRVAADPLLAGRVRRLEAGVDLPDATGGGGPPRPREIVGMIQTLFVLGPFDRAGRRRELLDGLPPPAAGWEQAARHVQHHHPAHAALEPALIDRLTTWTRRPKADARGVSRPAATWGFRTQGGLQVPQVPQVRPAAPRRRSPGWSAGIWIFVVLTAVRAFSVGLRETPPPQKPTYTIPQSMPPAPVQPNNGLGEEWSRTLRLGPRTAETTRRLDPRAYDPAKDGETIRRLYADPPPSPPKTVPP
jgi:hypothetical protein